MDPNLARTLQARQRRIRTRWEGLLRAELVNTPLANPDILVRLFETTLREVFAMLLIRRSPRRSAPAPSRSSLRTACACSRNPLLAYFITGEQALLENLMMLEAHKEQKTAAAELYVTIHQIARREIDLFCSLCQYRPNPSYKDNFCEDNANEREAVLAGR
jgi:hypothetical protein